MAWPTPRDLETAFHIPKLTLLEVGPLVPFLMDRDRITCIEVGGNIGLWCEAFHNVFAGRVAHYRAYEPMPGNVDRFRARIRDYFPSRWPEVRIEEVCLGDAEGEVDIRYHTDVTPLASVVVEEMQFGNSIVRNDRLLCVPQRTLDRELARLDLPHVDLVKIDVEGYEWNVLQGALAALASDRIANIYFEFGQHQKTVGQTFRQFHELLSGYGYRLFRQTVGRNYFGLNEIGAYDVSLEDFSSMWMILASRGEPSPRYRGPRVVNFFREPQ